jgi:hypothetical protein
MALRVTIEDVFNIMESDIVISVGQATAMLTVASLMIDKIFEDDTTVTDALLAEIEKWLAAHVIVSTLARMAEKEKVGQAEVTYIGKWGELLKSTPYGQTVLMLDITGKMANAGKKGASMYAVISFDE